MSAPNRYKVYPIKKRSGGIRIIAQPAREIKALQRIMVDELLCKLPVHEAATAYRKGFSILDNAEPHAKNGPILKMDLRDFFPSIKGKDWQSYCRDTRCLTDADDIWLSERILFRRPKGSGRLILSIGAPSSPALSNVLMHEFDVAVSIGVAKDHVVYTRYADDLTFSAPRTGHLVNVQQVVARAIRRISYPSLDINPNKTAYITKKYNRSVTGLTLTNDGNVSIGRENKRKIHATVHAALNGNLNNKEVEQLSGQLAYINSVEPTFISVLRIKYGNDIIDLIQKSARGPTE
jgi:hypothetical protein